MNIFGQINASMASVNQQKKGFLKQGWLRAVIFLVAFLLVSTLIGIIAGIIITTTHVGETITIQDIWSSPLRPVMVLISTLTGFLLVWIFTKFIDKRSLYSLGFRWKGFGHQAATGFFLPFGILGIGTLVLSFSKYLTWGDVQFDSTLFFINLVLMLLIAFSEELIFRGYILNNLMQSFNRYIALITSAVLFAALHMSGAGMNILPLFNIFLAGILLGLNYSFTRNLWFGIAFHFTWNFFQGPVLGYKVSGKAFSSILEQDMIGPVWLTGGDFGFEGAAVCSALLLITIIALEWVYRKNRVVESGG